MYNERNLKDLLYQEFARIGKSISSPKRIELLDLLSHGPKTVEALTIATTMSVANVSQHLQTLSNSKLVKSKKKGNYVIYELVDVGVIEFLNSLRTLSENQLVEVQKIKQEFMNSHLDVNGVSLEELKEKMESGEAILIDVRPIEEFNESHIPGAVSMPIKELAEKLASLPKNCEVVAYCRGCYCLMAVEAVQLLNSHGYNAFRLDKDVNEWNQFADSK
ncbi:ArsR/SmtB family transcription factor [Cytobacillus gottheilii]|uniref:Metalloregulator ArsR/SmtB family transcription factor n=1 Tax=Cytobacillus gottheilii TaxID=859144 RepID=A0ABX8FEZ4_9BACI|nr:metalloregulator ArsR/SmtB family transcription factor [Cytobacillus gottheilii]QVY62572.1 metalloregulator ArsR/SmtB family transcription factor [Cytobacillus gottheilii]